MSASAGERVAEPTFKGINRSLEGIHECGAVSIRLLIVSATVRRFSLRLKIALVLIAPALALVVVAFVGRRAAVRYVGTAQDRPPAAGAQRVPVLVELFTSEG